MSEKMSAEELAQARGAFIGAKISDAMPNRVIMPDGNDITGPAADMIVGLRIIGARALAHIATLQREADGMREALALCETALTSESLEAVENALAAIKACSPQERDDV